MATHSSLCRVRIGRGTEVAALDDFLAGVTGGGNGQLVFVSGDAGVGKSRLVGEVVRTARDRGLLTLVGQCTPNATIPYGPFVHAIRRGTRNLGPNQLAELFDGSATLAAALLPEVAATIGLPETSPSPESTSASVWHLLARLYRPAGGVLLLEDVHWADADSLRLLTDLARELDDLPLLLVATYRSDEMHRRHPLRAVVTELGRERRYAEVELKPLAREEIRAMLSEIFDGTDVGDDFTDVVLERTGGNPFFVEELAKVLVERGDVYHSGHDWERRDLADIEMPASVRETLLARTRLLSPRAVDVLKLAALASDRLDLAVLAEATSVHAEAVDDVIREGFNLQLLSEVRDGVGLAYVFRHALTREALADELVGPDRRRAHGRLAAAIALVHEADIDAYAAELADHHEAAGESEAAVSYALRAARSAAASFAVDEADHRYDQAFRLMPEADPARLELLLEASGDIGATDVSAMRVAFATEARALAAEQGDRIAEARAILFLERARWQVGDGPGAIRLTEDALRLARGLDDSLEAWLLNRLSRLLRLGDRIRESHALLAEGIELARRSGNDAALSGLYGTQMMTVSYGEEYREARDAALAAARAANDLNAELNLSTNRGYISLWCGDFAESRRGFDRARDLAARLQPNDHYCDAGFAWMLSLAGEYDAAQALAEPLLADQKLPTRVVAATALCEVAERRASAGFAAYAAELAGSGMGTAEAQRSVPSLSASSRLALVTQGVDAAAPVFWEAARTTAAGEIHGSHWLFSPDLAARLAEEGRTETLADWVEVIDALTVRDSNPHNVVADQLCRGYLDLARGELDDARQAFTEAAGTYRSMPCPAREAECLLGLAAADAADGRLPESAESARAAQDIADRIGAVTLASRARLALERTEALPVLATILMTDIVASTEQAARLGDHAWTDLLDRHHAIVRRELARARGREVDTAGDGFFAAFDLPAQAIRCALAIRDSLAAIGVHIRSGMHTGECQVSDGKLTGLTVHIAARVASAAAADEVFVSGTVRELVAGSGLVFEPRGTHVLKGVPGEWRLFAVTG